MTESTLIPPVAGEDENTTQPVAVEPGPSDAEPGAAERVDGAEAAPQAQATSAMPPALGPVDFAEVLAAQNLTTATPGEMPPQADEKTATPGLEEKAPSLEEETSPVGGTAETAAEASAVGAPMGENLPPDGDRAQRSPPVGAYEFFPAERDMSRSLTGALDAAAALIADADAATKAAARAPIGSEPVADPRPTDLDNALDAPALVPTLALAAADRVQSLTGALDAAAKLAADDNAVTKTVTEAPADIEPMLERPPADPDGGSLASAFAPAPAAAAAAGGNVQPLTSALGAAAKLAADANAAAEALESLQRLLQRQLPGVAVGLATPVPSADGAAWAAARAEPAKPPPLPPPAVPFSNNPSAGDPAGREPKLPIPLPPRRAPERVRFDVRGFLAGFALSWAFGVVLYLFMTAG